MNTELIRLVIEIMMFLATSGAGVYAYLVARNTASIEKVNKLETDVMKHISLLRSDISRLDERSKRSPTHDDLRRVHERIDSMDKTLSGIAGEFIGMRHTVNLIHDYLMQTKT